MKRIPLTRGLHTLVDDEDFDWLNQWKWYAEKNKKTWYARHRDTKMSILMHRLIMGLTDPKVFVDHIDHNTLNNQRSNLRIVTCRENSQNRKHKGVSQYTGVYWHKQRSKWAANIRIKGKHISLGLYVNEEDAARAYREAAFQVVDTVKESKPTPAAKAKATKSKR